MLIEGKTLQEYMDAPVGEFAKAARRSVDPHWGRESGELKKWKCHATLSRTRYEHETIDIEAFTEEEARDVAYKELNGDNYDDVDIDVVEVSA